MFDTSESGALHIRVVSEEGDPLPGAILTIMNLASRLERVTITNAEGMARFRVIPPGGYDLRARSDGFNSATKSNIEVYAGQETDVVIALSPLTPGD